MKTIVKKVLLLIVVLPLTLVLDFILYAFVKNCPSCGSYWQFIETEGALSFPIVIGATEWLNELFVKYLPHKTKR